MEKRLDGWWKVDYGGKVGFAPAIFLQRYDQEVDESKTTAIYMVPSLQEAVKQSMGGASSKGAEPTAKPRVSVTNEKSTILKQRSAESVTPPTRKESLAVNASPKVQKSVSSSVVQSAAMATALSVSAPSKSPTSPTRKSGKPQRPPQPFIKQSSHEGEQRGGHLEVGGAQCFGCMVQWNPALRTPLKSGHLDYADTF